MNGSYRVIDFYRPAEPSKPPVPLRVWAKNRGDERAAMFEAGGLRGDMANRIDAAIRMVRREGFSRALVEVQ